MNNLSPIQANGQVTLPPAWRSRLGLKQGDLVSLIETEAGLLITPRQVLANQLLNDIGRSLQAKGVTLDDLLANGATIRETVLKEDYDLTATA